MAVQILIVDDSICIRGMATSCLTSAGYDVFEAENGQEAIEQMESEAFDCIICDRHIPGMSGLELVRHIRQEMKKTLLPVVMLTTDSASDFLRAAKAAGATGWMAKPFSSAHLLAAVRKLTCTPTSIWGTTKPAAEVNLNPA